MDKPVKVTKDLTAQVGKAIKALSSKEVLIGIPDGASRSDGPLTNAEILFIQENGSEKKHIPARPVLLPGVASIQAKATDVLKDGAAKALGGNIPAAVKSMNAAGMLGRNAVIRKLTTGPFVPLSEVTLARRRARGVMSTKPLVDTGSLRKALTYVVRDK